MVHDLDLVHALLPGAISGVRATGGFVYGPSHDEVTAELDFETGGRVRLIADRAATERSRSLRLIYADGGEICLDFLTRGIVNTTGRELKLGDSPDPLGESVIGFTDAIRAGVPVLIRPEEALRALKTALMIDEALVPAVVSRRRQAIRRTA
jgi:predicted dehydrogenase